jgi:hypothetical protein
MSIVFVDEDFQSVINKINLSFAKMRSIIRDTGKTIEREALRNYRRTVNTWRKKPQFDAIAEYTESGFEILVGTDDKIYAYVDRGTRPHVIRPRGPWPLRFKSGYSAKTTPRVLSSSPGGAEGPTVYAREVFHPGTQAREFTDEIYKVVDQQARDLAMKKIRTAILGRGG